MSVPCSPLVQITHNISGVIISDYNLHIPSLALFVPSCHDEFPETPDKPARQSFDDQNNINIFGRTRLLLHLLFVNTTGRTTYDNVIILHSGKELPENI